MTNSFSQTNRNKQTDRKQTEKSNEPIATAQRNGHKHASAHQERQSKHSINEETAYIRSKNGRKYDEREPNKRRKKKQPKFCLL